MSFFRGETSKNVDFTYVSTCESRLIKCKLVNGNETSPNLFSNFDASINGEQNLWKDNRYLNTINENEIFVHIKDFKKRDDDFKCNNRTEKVEENKAELYIIQGLSDELDKIILVKTFYRNTLKSFSD